MDESFDLSEDSGRDPLRELREALMGDSASKHLRIPSELTWEPPTDVIETGEEIIIIVDISGMDGKDISVLTDGEVLRVRGTRRAPGPAKASQFHQLEIRFGPFERIVELPSRVDQNKVSAQYSRGLLEVRIRKLPKSDQVKRIEID